MGLVTFFVIGFVPLDRGMLLTCLESVHTSDNAKKITTNRAMYVNKWNLAKPFFFFLNFTGISVFVLTNVSVVLSFAAH